MPRHKRGFACGTNNISTITITYKMKQWKTTRLKRGTTYRMHDIEEHDTSEVYIVAILHFVRNAIQVWYKFN